MYCVPQTSILIPACDTGNLEISTCCCSELVSCIIGSFANLVRLIFIMFNKIWLFAFCACKCHIGVNQFMLVSSLSFSFGESGGIGAGTIFPRITLC
jgi:hypothetical protein